MIQVSDLLLLEERDQWPAPSDEDLRLDRMAQRMTQAGRLSSKKTAEAIMRRLVPDFYQVLLNTKEDE